MVEPEPSAWELSRRLDALSGYVRDGFTTGNLRMDKLVSADLYQARAETSDRRFAAIETELATEEAERRADIGRIHEEQQVLARERETWRQQRILLISGAALAFVASLVISVIGRL